MTLPHRSPGGQVVLLTGAGRGIGQAIANNLAARGDRLIINDIENDALQETLQQVTAASGEVTAVPGDVSDPAVVDRIAAAAISRFGRIDGLVNNAGIGGTGKSLVELSLAEWHRMLEVDLTSVFLMCKAVVPQMTAQGRGRIVNISSVTAQMGVAGSTHYAAAKAGVIGLSKSLARELAEHRINVNVVAPGLIDTEMARNRGIDHQRHLVLWPRVGDGEDIAAVVSFLLDDRSEFITGQVISPNGGAYM